ncbi:kinase-related protein [Sclerotinia borealis F-4128]|uniref:Kinase-related protein n=1 Tax=Sclerotinia borealis (strain F-4128) TaxID=1432307 RepID=W9C6D2_SCLBF|nr:kinase-related protein [Sclerotinia borealis F-4128]
MEDEVTRLTEKRTSNPYLPMQDIWSQYPGFQVQVIELRISPSPLLHLIPLPTPNQHPIHFLTATPTPGKTTLAATITKRLNLLQETHSNTTSSPPLAGFIPMDGYHLTRAQLSAMPDPIHAHARRGAAFTFDGPSFLTLIRKVREPITSSTPTIHAPSFDHALKDPRADDIPIEPTTRILIFEGNYLSLDKEPWRSAAKLMDQLWFVDVNFEVAKRRLIPRHVRAGIAEDEVEAEKRVVENDLVNGEEIVRDRMVVHEVIVSTDDVAWK